MTTPKWTMMTKMMTDSEDKPEEEVSAIVASSDTRPSKDSPRIQSKVLGDVKRTTRQQSRNSKEEKRGSHEVTTVHDLQRVQRVYDRHPVAFQRWLQESAPEEIRSLLVASVRPTTTSQQTETTNFKTSGKDLFQQWVTSTPLRVSQSTTELWKERIKLSLKNE